MNYLKLIIFFIFLLLASYVANAQEVVSVEGQYSYGPDISDNVACERATMIAKNEAIRRVSGENISNYTIEDCIQTDCTLYEKTWSSLGKNSVIKSTSNFTKIIIEEVGANTCKVKFDAKVEVIRENLNKDFYITTDFGIKKKIFKASSSKSAKDGDTFKMKINLSKPAYVYVYGWYPIDNENKLVKVISYPQNTQVKKSYNFPQNGEAYFWMSDTNKQNSASEYLLLIASKQKIDLGEDIDFGEMKKILYDIPTSNWAIKRISYTVKR